MPEKGSEELTGAEGTLSPAELSKLERQEKSASKAEIKEAKSEISEKGHEAEAKLAKEAEREETELKKAKQLDKAKDNQEKKKDADAKKSEKRQPRVASTPKERKRAYKHEMRQVQAQLSPGARTFSKVVHNSAVETTSDVAEKTVLRPSVLIGGAVVGILLGGLIYYSAHHYGYPIPSWSLVFFLVIGGLLGVIIEFLLKATQVGKKH